MKATSFFEKDEDIFVNVTLYVENKEDAKKIGTYCFNPRVASDEFEKYGAGYYHILCQRTRGLGFKNDVFKMAFIGEDIMSCTEFFETNKFLKNELLYIGAPAKYFEAFMKNPAIKFTRAEYAQMEELDIAEIEYYKDLIAKFNAGEPMEIPKRKKRKNEIEREDNYRVDFAQMEEDGFTVYNKKEQ